MDSNNRTYIEDFYFMLSVYHFSVKQNESAAFHLLSDKTNIVSFKNIIKEKTKHIKEFTEKLQVISWSYRSVHNIKLLNDILKLSQDLLEIYRDQQINNFMANPSLIYQCYSDLYELKNELAKYESIISYYRM